MYTLTCLILLGSQPKSTGNLLWDLIISSKVDTVTAVRMDQLLAKLPNTQLLPVEWDLLSGFIGSHVASMYQALEQIQL